MLDPNPTSGTVQMVSAVLTFLTTIGVAWIGYLTATAKSRADAAAARVEMAQRQTAAAVKVVAQTVAVTAQETKAATQQVATTLAAVTVATDTKLDDITNVVKASHVMVNAAYGASLLGLLNARKLVLALTTDYTDRRVAQVEVDDAQRLYDDHVAKQAEVDATIVVPHIDTDVEKSRPG